MKKVLHFLLFLLIFIIGVGALAVYWTFYRPLPDYDTTLEQPALEHPVDIHWDSQGVPHIYAKNKHDLYYSLGYVHAQDRLWQMTINQMAAEGRFSEFFGEDLLDYDRLQRTIGFWRIAQKIEETLSDSTRNYLQAYAKGVNNYVNEHPKSLPIEFTLTGVEPIPWSPTHSVAMARLMAWELNVSWRSELAFAHLSENLPSNKFAELLPSNRYVADMVTDTTTLKWADALKPVLSHSEELRTLMGTQGSLVGSNAWAISGEKSSTDSVLLAGDPHLGLDMPGKWYEAHLNIDGENLSGATLAGAPIVVLGQNDHLAWSLTNIMLDDTDFYQEAVNPDNPEQYVLDSLAGDPLYEDFEIQKEIIKVKNHDDVVFERKVSKHGPVISEVFPEQQFIDDRVITMQWTGYEISNEIEALLTMNWASSFEEFEQGARQFKTPGQHFIYGDKDGNIARLALANIPIRSGNPIVLREGWNPSLDWRGYVPYEELPSEINPQRGWVANANNQIVDDDYPYYVSVYWQPESRYDRIRQYLTQDAKLSPQIFQQMQNDTYSLYAQELTQEILPILKKSGEDDFTTAISYLENWDYTYESSETAASILDQFILRLSSNLFLDEMGPEVYESYVKISAFPALAMMKILKDGSSFFDNSDTPERTESREELIIQSMRETLQQLRQNYGKEPFEWRWENLHTITLEPPLLGAAAKSPEAPSALKLIVNNLFNKGPYPVGGHDMSVNNGEYNWNEPFDMILGPSIRRIIDFSDLSSTLSITPTGQSGNPLSQYYGDQTESWLNGQYKILYQDSSFFNEAQYNTMKLRPN